MTSWVRRPRRGLLLPLVLVVMMLVSLLAAGAQHSAWRAARGSQAQWDTQRASYRAEAAAVAAVAEWSADSMGATPIGVPVRHSIIDAGDWQTDVLRMRTSAHTAVVVAAARRDRSIGAQIDPSRIRRVVSRVIYLDAPRWPIRGAITALGALDSDSAYIEGRDVLSAYQPHRDDCGPLRDTASLPALAAAVHRSSIPWGAAGDTLTLGLRDRVRDEAHFDSSMAVVRARLSVTPHPSGAPLAGRSAWRPIVIADSGGVTVRGVSSHVGLLVVDGDLVVDGVLRVDGLLVVRGLLDASRGTLIVRGAVVLREGGGRWARLSATSDIRYAPCLASRALVGLAVPRTKPFSVWHSP